MPLIAATRNQMALTTRNLTAKGESAAEPGAYLTDGSRLFRVIDRLHPPDGDRATLEDCSTLEVATYSADELWPMNLTLVRGPRRSTPKAAQMQRRIQ
jgi:hypothetical protein